MATVPTAATPQLRRAWRIASLLLCTFCIACSPRTGVRDPQQAVSPTGTATTTTAAPTSPALYPLSPLDTEWRNPTQSRTSHPLVDAQVADARTGGNKPAPGWMQQSDPLQYLRTPARSTAKATRAAGTQRDRTSRSAGSMAHVPLAKDARTRASGRTSASTHSSASTRRSQPTRASAHASGSRHRAHAGTGIRNDLAGTRTRKATATNGGTRSAPPAQTPVTGSASREPSRSDAPLPAPNVNAAIEPGKSGDTTAQTASTGTFPATNAGSSSDIETTPAATSGPTPAASTESTAGAGPTETSTDSSTATPPVLPARGSTSRTSFATSQLMLATFTILLVLAVLLAAWLYARHRRRIAYREEQRATELFVATVEQSVSRSMGKGMPPRAPAAPRPVAEQPDALVWQDPPDNPIAPHVDPSIPPEVRAGLEAAHIELVPVTVHPESSEPAPPAEKAFGEEGETKGAPLAAVAAAEADEAPVIADADAVTPAEDAIDIEMIEYEPVQPSNAKAPDTTDADTFAANAIALEAASTDALADSDSMDIDSMEAAPQEGKKVELDELTQLVEDAILSAESGHAVEAGIDVEAGMDAEAGIDAEPLAGVDEGFVIEGIELEDDRIEEIAEEVATDDTTPATSEDQPAPVPAVLAVIASGAAAAAAGAAPRADAQDADDAAIEPDGNGVAHMSDRPARYNDAMREGELLHRRLAAIGRDHPERAKLLAESQAAHARAAALNEKSAKAWARLGSDRLQLADMAGDAATELDWLRQAVDAFAHAASIDQIPANDTLQRIRMQAWHRIGMAESDERVVRDALHQAVALAEAHWRMEPRNADAALRLHGMLCDLAGHCQGREHDDVVTRALDVLDETAKHHPEMAQDLDLQRLLTRFVGLSGSHGAQQIFKLAELDRLFTEQAESQQRNPVFLVGWSRVLGFWAQRVTGEGAVQLFDRADALLQQADALRPGHAPVLRQWAHTLHLRSRSQRDAPRLASLGAALQKLEAIPAEERNRGDLRNILRTRLAWAQESRSPQADAVLAEFAGELAPALGESDSMMARELRAEASLILARRSDDPMEKRAMLRRAMRDLRTLESGNDTPWWAEAMLARLHAERATMEGETGTVEDIREMSRHYERAVALNPEPALLREWQEILRGWQEQGLGNEHRMALEAATQCYDRAVRRSRPGAARRMA